MDSKMTQRIGRASGRAPAMDGDSPHPGGRRASVPYPPLVAEWLAALKAWGLSPKTCKNYGSDLVQFTRYLAGPLESARLEDITGFAEAMDDRGLDARTRQRRLVAVRQFYQYLVDRGHITASPAVRVRLPKISSERIPDFLTDAEIVAVRGAFARAAREAATPEDRARAIRDRALFECGLASLRVAEVLGIRLDGLLRLDHHQVKIRAKGGKERLQQLPDDAVAAIKAWQAVRPPCRSPYLFVAMRTRGTRALHYVRVEQIIRRYYRLAGVTRELRRPFHALRHTAGTKLGERGFPLQDIQDILNHADPRTTRIYVRLGGQRLRDVVRRGLRFPHPGRR